MQRSALTIICRWSMERQRSHYELCRSVCWQHCQRARCTPGAFDGHSERCACRDVGQVHGSTHLQRERAMWGGSATLYLEPTPRRPRFAEDAQADLISVLSISRQGPNKNQCTTSQFLEFAPMRTLHNNGQTLSRCITPDELRLYPRP